MRKSKKNKRSFCQKPRKLYWARWVCKTYKLLSSFCRAIFILLVKQSSILSRYCF